MSYGLAGGKLSETSEHNFLNTSFINAKIRTDIQSQQYRLTSNEYYFIYFYWLFSTFWHILHQCSKNLNRILIPLNHHIFYIRNILTITQIYWFFGLYLHLDKNGTYLQLFFHQVLLWISTV